MRYDVINPSDPYTLDADSLEVAAIAICLVGEGKYALKPLDSSAPGVPLFVLGSPDWWFTAQFARPFEASLAHILMTEKPALIAALESIVIGTPQDRVRYDALMAQTEASKQALLRQHWHAQHRSSLNDIGARAWRIAAHLAEEPSHDLPR